MGHISKVRGTGRAEPSGAGAVLVPITLAGTVLASLTYLVLPGLAYFLFGTFVGVSLWQWTLLRSKTDEHELGLPGLAEVRAIQDCSPVGVFYVDNQGGCRYVNSRFLEISGLTMEQVHEAGWGNPIHPDDRAWVVDKWRKATAGQDPFEATLRYLLPSGDTVWITSRAAPVFDKGVVIGYAGAIEDITLQKLAEEQARNAHHRLSATLESIHDGFLSLDHEWGVTYVNQAACDMFAKDRAEVVGESLLELFPTLENSILVLYCREVMAGGQPQVFETQDGDDELWYEVRVYPAPDGVSIFYQDITSRKIVEVQIEESMMQISEYSVRLELQQQELAEANDKLEALATTDGLTGLRNHRTFQDRLSAALAGDRFPVSLLLLDVDKFKTFNDEFGHQAGDEVLIGVGRVLESVARDDEFVARYGGEEFVVILPGQDATAARESAERFRHAIESEEWGYRPVTASFGCSTATASSDDKTTLISQADQALYVSKSRGRNRCTHFSETREAASLAA